MKLPKRMVTTEKTIIVEAKELCWKLNVGEVEIKLGRKFRYTHKYVEKIEDVEEPDNVQVA